MPPADRPAPDPAMTPAVGSRDAILEALIEALPDPVWAIGSSGTLVVFNQRFVQFAERLFGSTPVRGMLFNDVISSGPAESREDFWLDLQNRALAGGAVFAEDWFLVGGERCYLAIASSPFPVPDQGAVFTVRDLTETTEGGREDATELTLTRLFASELPLRESLLSSVEFLCEADGWDAGIVWLIDKSDESLYPSVTWSSPSLRGQPLRAATEKMRFNYGQDLPGRAWQAGEILWVPDLQAETEIHRHSFALDLGLRGIVLVPISDSGNVLGVLELFTRAVRPLAEQKKRALLRTGAALGHLTSRHRTEDERRHLQSLIERKGYEWTATFDAIEMPIFLISREGEIIRVNRAARDLAAIDYMELVGRQLSSLGPGEPWKTLCDLTDTIMETRSSCTAHITDERRIWDVAGSFCHIGEIGEGRIILALRDMTTLIRLQESVVRGEQLAILGELVDGVAHEVKNPIFGMTLAIDTLGSLLHENAEADELLGLLRKWIGRMNRLMENLLEYGKTWTMELKSGIVGDIMQQAIETHSGQARQAGVTIASEIEAGLEILMDPARLLIVFENLVTNALQHSASGGEVEITVKHGEDAFAECVVRDHGPGFVVKDLSRVFQPFFTKRRGGTGLGLSIVQRIVDEHGGTVIAENHPNGGAVVRILLPLFEGGKSA